MSREKIKQLISSLAKAVEDNQKVATPILAAKLAKCSATFPHDQTIGAMSRVISKMAANNTIFISKADLKQLYSKLYFRNTKFAELFQDELGIVETPEVPAVSTRDDSSSLNAYEVGDTVLANALTSVFDKNAPLKMYSQTLANKALASVTSTLDAWNLKPNSLKVDDGNDKFLVVKAEYETPKGVTSFYVPIEIHNNKVVEATMFMGNTGPQKLNHIAIKSYLTSSAGNKLKINATSILSVLTKAASENREISDAEIAVTKLNATRQGKSEFFANQIVGQKVAEASVKDVELPKSDEFVSFEKQFTSPYGMAAYKFGTDKVKIAREHIVRELTSFGHKNPQVTVAKSDNTSIFYSVSLDGGRVGFTVPVKIEAGKISKPGLMLCAAAVANFNKEGINNLYVTNSTDFKAAASASPLFGLKPSDVIDSVRKAVDEGNHSKAEDALNVLASSGDEKAYATAFQIYMSGLSNKMMSTAKPSSCSMIVKNSKVSEHPICGHTGLPLHKTYQDKEGNCRPLYRRDMDDTYEGASFMNSKIFG